MNATEQPSVDSTLQLMPVVKAFTAWRVADKISQTVNSNPPERHVESHTVRNHNVSQMVIDTGGYFHGGLND